MSAPDLDDEDIAIICEEEGHSYPAGALGCACGYVEVCRTCGGSGRRDDVISCPDCDGEGEFTW